LPLFQTQTPLTSTWQAVSLVVVVVVVVLVVQHPTSAMAKAIIMTKMVNFFIKFPPIFLFYCLFIISLNESVYNAKSL